MDKKVIVHDGKIKLDGWAYSGGGNWVERVEVSPDGYVFIFAYFPCLLILFIKRPCLVCSPRRESH